jgi:proline iminopeptidase
MTPFRAVLSWLVLLAVAYLNGAIRQLAYPSTLGDFAARQVAAGVGAVAFGFAIWFLLRRWPLSRARHAWATGALWAVLTVAFEVALVRGGGRPWDDVVDQYALWKGSLWPLLVLWVLAAPASLSALQRSRIAVGPALRWALVGWMACGVVFAVARAVLGVDAAVWIHLLAAPVIGAVVTLLLWTHPRHPGVVATALMLAGTAAYLDATVVAPFLERSFAMFASPAGTWIPLALIFAASAGTAALLSRPAARRDLLGWVATAREQEEPLPGDDLLAREGGATHAITIAAPPAAVWPWLAQMGYGRAGWYSHDRLDNGGHPSAEEIRPELTAIARGDLIPSSAGGRTSFEVLDLREGAHLVLGFHMVWPFRSARWAEPSTRVSQRATWTFALRPAGGGATRLLVRARGTSRPGWLWAPWTAFFFVAHVPMQRKQLLGIRRRAEGAGRGVPSPGEGPTPRRPAGRPAAR